LRLIKFRAWDKAGTFINKETGLAEPHMIENVGISIRLSDLTGLPGWFGNGGLHIPGDCEDFVLMQFAGLTDNDGQEIYEGDIVAGDDEIWGVVKWDVMGCRFYLHDDYDNFGLDEFDPKFLTILGNIHENPVLLKERDDTE
jgi:hypothetical protein